MDRALEYFDMDWAASGIRMFESPIIEEFVNSAIALYAETGAISPQLMYESFSPTLRLFLEGLPEEKWRPPQEIVEFYQTLTVFSTKLCDRQKRQIPLNSNEAVTVRMQMSKFTQGMQTLNKLFNAEKINIDAFADQIVRSKAQLIQFQAAISGAALPENAVAETPAAVAPTAPSTVPHAPEAPRQAPQPPQNFAAQEVPEASDNMEPPEGFEPPPPEDDEEYSYGADENQDSNDDFYDSGY